jgi:CDP-diacylglycerol--serine O-phosphatidyltransferase
MLPISFFHYQKLKTQNQDSSEEDDDLEDVL